MVSHPRCDDLRLTHLTVQHKESVYIRGKEKSKRFSPRVHMFCISCWERMTFHFPTQVISKGLIQIALQAVPNPLSIFVSMI